MSFTGPWEPNLAWRNYCDRLHEGWLGAFSAGTVLKTDLYDESLTGGLFPWLSRRCIRVVGVDICPATVARARLLCPGLEAMVADVRALPFADGELDLVVSNSTLDHFASPGDIAVGLAEIHRVLRPGGVLALTLDNPCNPLVFVRNRLPGWRWLRRSGVSPYFAPHTLSMGALRRALEGVGFEVQQERYLMHVFRFLAVHLAPWLPLRFLLSWEALDALPTRPFTGYFVAVTARRSCPG